MTATITRSELISNLYDNSPITKEQAGEIVTEFFDIIRREISKGNSVKLANFGTFNLLEKSERPGRNPATGEIIPVSARKSISFRASPQLKELVIDLKLQEKSEELI